jgi:prophage regulatory protein
MPKDTNTKHVRKPERIPDSLPRTGKSRWRQLQYFIPVSRETWRKLQKENRAPRPQLFGKRCALWDNSEVHDWLSDPSAYRVPEQS